MGADGTLAGSSGGTVETGKVDVARQLAQEGLHRSRDAYLAGVCAGIAEQLEFDPIVIRILAVLLALTTFGAALVVYIALWVYLPREPETAALYDVMPERAESSAYGFLDCVSASEFPGEQPTASGFVTRLAVAVALVLLFMTVAVNISPLVTGSSWWQFWPLVLLMGGLCLVIIPIGTKHVTAWHAFGIALTSAAASLLPMSLGVVAWETVPYAFSQLWTFVVVGAIMFGFGYSRNVSALMVAGALCFAAFCLVSLMLYSIPGDSELVALVMSDGGALRLVFAGR